MGSVNTVNDCGFYVFSYSLFYSPSAPSLLRKEGVLFPSPQGLSQRTLRLHDDILQGPLAGDPAGTEVDAGTTIFQKKIKIFYLNYCNVRF